jgi:hypothetical protein
MFSNDYVSEFLLNFEPERGLVVHLVVGIHVADVVVLDQVHVTKLIFNSTNVVVNHVASRVSTQNNQIFQIWTDLYHRHYNKLKNDLRLPLTNTVKELGAIL